MKKLSLISVITALAISGSALAHTVWLRQDATKPDTFQVYFGGHGGAITPYDASKFKSVKALDAAGKELAVTRSGNNELVRLQVAGKPVLLAVYFDNGIHAKTGTGPSVPRPMNEVPGALSATNAQKYHKTIVRWGPSILTRPVGQPFEVVPLSAKAPLAGKPMRVQVRIDGEPAAGVKVGPGEDIGAIVTDASGVASFTPEKGFNKIWAGRRTQVSGNPTYTELSYEYSLGFVVP